MNYTVLWTPSAERDLTELWLRATDRGAVRSAADTLDSLLRIDAHAVMSRLRIRGQRHLDPRRQRAVGHELPSGLTWRELRAPEQIGEQADGGPLESTPMLIMTS